MFWERAGRPMANLTEAIKLMHDDANRFGIRLGSYGEPSAVPYQVWQSIFDALPGIRWTGYTHQHRAMLFNGIDDSYSHWKWCQNNLMASCDSPQEAELAKSAGWRYFLAMSPGMTPPDKSIECLAERTVNPLQCSSCGICNGSNGKSSRASVYLKEHGARSSGKAKRSASLTIAA